MQDSVTQDRQKYIGGSDIPIILGISPYKKRFRLLQEKAKLVEAEAVDNPYIRFGNVMEAKIRDYINNNLVYFDDPFVEGKHITEGEVIGVRCHTDGENENCILEIKTTSEVDKNLPLYECQLCFYMMQTGKTRGLLAVYIRPEDMSEEFDENLLTVYEYTISDFEMNGLVKKIDDAVVAFVDDLVAISINPNITEEDLIPDELVDVANEIIAFESRMEALNELEKKIKAEKNKLFEAMTGANVKSWRTINGWLITRVDPIAEKIEQTEEFDIEKFKAEKPDEYSAYLHTVDKKKSGRSGYVKITKPKKGAE